MSRTPVPFIAPDAAEWAPHDEGTRFGLDDQPTTCPHCSARTEEDDNEDGSQNHTCLSCGFRFVGDWDDWTEDDEDDDTPEDCTCGVEGPLCRAFHDHDEDDGVEGCSCGMADKGAPGHDDHDERGPRVLHLGLVALDRTATTSPTPPTAYGVCLGWADPVIRAGEDSFRAWGNTDDPDECHDFDGTLHIEVYFDGEDFPVGAMVEDDTAQSIGARYAHYLADAALPWRLADYAVWSDDAHSENQHHVSLI